MSSFLNAARARTLRPGGGLPRPRLTIVPKVAVRAPRVPFALLVVTVLAAGLLGLLLLNTSLQRGAYVVTDLKQRSADLTLEQQNIELEVAALEAPQRISERAVRLGMVAGDSPAFLSLKTGKVIGVPRAGTRAQRPALALTTSPSSQPPPGTDPNGRRRPATAGPPSSVASPTKLTALVSGEAASLSHGAVKVARQHGDKHGDKNGGQR